MFTINAVQFEHYCCYLTSIGGCWIIEYYFS